MTVSAAITGVPVIGAVVGGVVAVGGRGPATPSLVLSPTVTPTGPHALSTVLPAAPHAVSSPEILGAAPHGEALPQVLAHTDGVGGLISQLPFTGASNIMLLLAAAIVTIVAGALLIGLARRARIAQELDPVSPPRGRRAPSVRAVRCV